MLSVHINGKIFRAVIGTKPDVWAERPAIS